MFSIIKHNTMVNYHKTVFTIFPRRNEIYLTIGKSSSLCKLLFTEFLFFHKNNHSNNYVVMELLVQY